MKKRHVFYLSDGTGITAQTMGQSLLSQFEGVEFITQALPYLDDEEKVEGAVAQIEACFDAHQTQPIVFTTIVQPKLKDIIHQSRALVLDFLQSFIGPLEKSLDQKSTHTIGRTHGMSDFNHYSRRIDALNFSLNTDDGACTHQYANADLILVGVSRCGKTPTSLYLSLHFGVFVANYPITEDDMDSFMLPKSLQPYKEKLFGLTIDVERLIAIRNERKPDSRYASLKQCNHEIKTVEKLLKRDKIPYLNSTHLSIEELSTKIMALR
jgi:[pyruvate, water dikinase]-phosphate phosphotransferase / [pyruvate, water dikinase] kinase